MEMITTSTPNTFMLKRKDGQHMMARRWVGHADDGVPIHAYVVMVSPQTHDKDVADRFSSELDVTADGVEPVTKTARGPPAE